MAKSLAQMCLQSTYQGFDFSSVWEASSAKTPKLKNVRFVYPTGISATENVTVYPEKPINLSIKVSPSNATNKNVLYKSSNPAVASVSAVGKVTGIKAGTAVITIVSTTSPNIKTTCKVTVAKSKINVASAGYNSIRISWSKASGASGYQIYRATSSSGTYSKVATVTSGSTVSYTNKSLTTGKTYYYKVRAYRTIDGDKMYGSFSAVQSAKPVPSMPTVTAKSSGYNSVKVSWNKISGASGYAVYQATSKSGSYSKVGTVTSGSTVSYTNKSLTTGKTYYYKVRAYRTVSGDKVYSGYSSIQSAKPVPAKPSSVEVAKASSTSLKVSWGSVTGASGYEVYRSTSSSGTYTKVKTTTSKSYTNTKLAKGKTYYYKVRAYRTVSGKKVYGSFSGVVSAKP